MNYLHAGDFFLNYGWSLIVPVAVTQKDLFIIIVSVVFSLVDFIFLSFLREYRRAYFGMKLLDSS